MPALTLCEQCGQEPAMVFVLTKQGDTEREQALCGFCAREQKIPQVEEMLAQMDISDAEFRKLHEDIMQQTQEPKGILPKLKRMFKG